MYGARTLIPRSVDMKMPIIFVAANSRTNVSFLPLSRCFEFSVSLTFLLPGLWIPAWKRSAKRCYRLRQRWTARSTTRAAMGQGKHRCVWWRSQSSHRLRRIERCHLHCVPDDCERWRYRGSLPRCNSSIWCSQSFPSSSPRSFRLELVSCVYPADIVALAAAPCRINFSRTTRLRRSRKGIWLLRRSIGPTRLSSCHSLPTAP